jgi:2-succinyl-6-hydroxy-2,4-cyclohexadiene-1-carboxylate synthase
MKENSQRAPRVAFVHGFAGDAHAWDDVIAALGGTIDPIRVALPGHHRAPVATWDAGLDAVAAQTAGADVVIGYSLGARVALGLIATARAPAAILIGVHPGLVGDDERAARRRHDRAWIEHLRAHGTAAFAEVWEAQPMFASQTRASVARRDARRAHRRALDADGLARSLESMGLAEMPDYHAAIAAGADRLHLVVGADDVKFRTLAEAMVAECPTLPLDLVTASGHDPTLEQPEGLSTVLARALARLAPSRLAAP